MSTSPTPRPHRRVRSVPIQLNFQITPLTSRSTTTTSRPAPTSGTATPSSSDSPADAPQPRKRPSRRGSRSSGNRSPSTHSTALAYEDHPSFELKRSSSTFFLSSLPSYRHDWTYRHGARVAAESLEQEGRSWLVSRASSTDLASQQVFHVAHDEDDVEGEEEEEDGGMYHRHTRDLEILDIGETLHEDIGGEETEEEGEEEFNWTRWVKTFMDFGEESDDDDDGVQWRKEVPRRRTVAFVETGMSREVDEAVVQRARERDEEHGLDGWMDGAAYLAFLGVRALGVF